nr:hypothetical protein [Tanacetum cinerariifolium]
MHAEESRSKMNAKQNDPQLIEKKVITKPIDYANLNQLSTDFNTRFVPHTESYAEQAFWSQYSVQTDEPTHSGTTIVEVPKELPKVSMRDNVSSSESDPTFAELFETNELKAQIQEKDTVILKLKEKIKSLRPDDKESKVEDIETQNLELVHRVTKLTAENKHLKQTYKQLFDSIKSSRVQSKEQCDDLINQVNLKSVEVADLNASLQEKVLVITALKEQLKGKAVIPKDVSLNPIDPALLQVDVVPLIPKLRKNRTAHIDYLKHTLEEAATLRELVESERLLSPLNTPLAYACKYTRRIQELLMILQQTCPRITDLGTNLVAVTPKNQNKQVRHTPQITKSEKPSVDTSTSPNIESNSPVLSSTGVALVSSDSGSQSKDNTKKNRIRRTLKKAKETELEDHPRKAKSSLNKARVVDSRANSSVIKSVSNVTPDLKCATCNRCLFSDNHDKCVVEYINSVNACRKSKSAKKTVNRKVYIILVDQMSLPIIVLFAWIMATTIEQQTALDDSLVPSSQRLRIGRNNFRLPSDIQSKEATLQVVYDVLRNSPLFRAFQVTADVPEIYMQEFWATAKLHHFSIRFKIDTRKSVLDLEAFREMLHISPRTPNQPFADLPTEEEVLDFLRFLGHSHDIRYLTDVNVNKLYQPWRSFASVINKCLTGKSS